MSTFLYDDFFNNTIANWTISSNMNVSISNGWLNMSTNGFAWNYNDDGKYGGVYRTLSQNLTNDFYVETYFESNKNSYAQFYLSIRNNISNKYVSIGYTDGNGGSNPAVVSYKNGAYNIISTYAGKLKVGIRRIGTDITIYTNNVLRVTYTGINDIFNEIRLSGNGYGNMASSGLKYDYVFVNNTSSMNNGMLSKFLLKQYNNYYSILPQYYDITNKMYIPLELSGGSIPNTSDLKTFGFDNINDMFNNLTINGETFKPIDKLYNNFEIKMYKGK